MESRRSNIEFVLDNQKAFIAFTNRYNGFSKGAFSSFNLAFHVGDDCKDVVRNRQKLADCLGVKKLVFMDQIHSNNVEILEKLDDTLPPCDAIVTNLKQIGICVMVADCAPILLLDEKQNTICAIHAGRAGVVSRICTNAIKIMQEKFGCISNNIKAFVGANIKLDCYEIGGLNLNEFNKFKKHNKFDLNAAIKSELLSLGVTNIYFDNTCTHCDERFFSYRRDGVTGRFCGVIGLK